MLIHTNEKQVSVLQFLRICIISQIGYSLRIAARKPRQNP